MFSVLLYEQETDIFIFICLLLHENKSFIYKFVFIYLFLQYEMENRVRTEIENQNSRTFPGLFKDYLHFSRSHFSWTVTHLTLLIRRISVPFKVVNAFPFRAHCFCLISALCIVSARYFGFCLSRFPLCKVSLPVAFDSYYSNQIE